MRKGVVSNENVCGVYYLMYLKIKIIKRYTDIYVGLIFHPCQDSLKHFETVPQK
jgi:hypothetical protein